MEVPEPKIDELLRIAIEQKRLIEFVFKNKPRVVEPHDYGIHKGRIKLFGYQVGGLSSKPLPNWRWPLVNSIGDLRLLNQTFPGRRRSLSGQTSSVGSDLHPSRATGSRSRPSTTMGRRFIESGDCKLGDSRKQIAEPGETGLTFTSSQEVMKLHSTAADLPPRSLPKKVWLAAAHSETGVRDPKSNRDTASCVREITNRSLEL